MNKPVLHPLESMQVEIEKNGWIVLENVNRMPVYNEPYISPHFMIVINHQGISHGEYDFQPIVFRKHDFAVIYPNHTILAKDTSEDYRVTLIVMSGPFFDKMRNRLTYENSSFYNRQPLFHLSEQQYNCMCDIVSLLNSVSKMDLERKSMVITDIIDVLTELSQEFYSKNTNYSEEKRTKKRANSRNYFYQFYELLVDYYLESREVAFYARKLCVSPKYFGFIIKRETGVSAGQWIARYVMIRAKDLLRHRTDLTIQQIAFMLNFDDYPSFSRFFKNNGGISAKVYRNQFLS